MNVSRISDYTLVKTIESGPRSILYLATNGSGAEFIVKFHRKTPGLDGPASSPFFLHELDVLSLVRHPNVNSLVQFGTTTDGLYDFLVVRRFGGVDFLTGCNSMSKPDFYNVLAQVCSALQTLHEEGFLHGDLKPANILVDASAVKAMLVDFDHARASETRAREAASGTLAYMAPELLLGNPPSCESDLYSLGAVLYESLTGTTPPSSAMDASAARHERGSDPSKRHEGHLGDLHRLVTALLSRDSRRRPASVAEVSQVLHLDRDHGIQITGDELWSCRSETAVGRNLRLLAERIMAEVQAEMPANSSRQVTLALLAGPPGAGKSATLHSLGVLAMKLGRPVRFVGTSETLEDGLRDLSSLSSQPWVHLIDNLTDGAASGLCRLLNVLCQRRQPATVFATVASQYVCSLTRGIEPTPPACRFLRLELQPLTATELASIACATSRSDGVDPKTAAAILAASGGNRRIAARILSAGLANGVLVREGGILTTGRPIALDSILEQEVFQVRAALAELPAPAILLAQALAADSGPLSASSLAKVTGLSEENVALGLEALVNHGHAVHPAGAPQGLNVLANTLVRSAILGMLAADVRAQLFTALGEFHASEAASPDHDARAARCFAAAHDRERAHRHAVAAARVADDRLDYHEALSFYTLAAQMNVPNLDTTEIALSRARCLQKLGSLGEARALLEDAARVKGLASPLLVRCHLALADLAMTVGDLSAMRHAAHFALLYARSSADSTLIVRAKVALGNWRCQGRDHHAGRRSLLKASVQARRLHLDTLVANSLHTLASSWWRSGEYSRALLYLKRSAALQPAHYRSALHEEGILLMEVGRYSRAQRTFSKALHHWGCTPGSTRALVTIHNQAECHVRQGHWTAGLRFIRRAGELAAGTAPSEQWLATKATGSILMSRLSHYSEAWQQLAHQLKYAATTSAPQIRIMHYMAWATLLRASGAQAFALRVALKARSLCRIAKLELYMLEIACLISECEAAAGNLTAALATLSSAFAEHRDRSPFDIVQLARLRLVEFQVRLNGWTPALTEELDSLIALMRRKKLRYHLGMALILKSSAAIERGEFDESEPALREVATTASRTGDRRLFIEAHYWLGRLYEKQLRYERALRCYRIAMLSVQETSMNIVQDRYRKTFEEQPLVSDIRQRYARLRAEVGKRRRRDVARLSRSERASRKMIGALSAIGQNLGAIRDLEDLLPAVLDLAIENVGAERGMVFLKEPATGEMRLASARGMDGEDLDDASSFSRSVIRKAAQGETLLTVDVGKEAALAPFESLVLHAIKSILCVPMKARGAVVGVLYLDTRKATRMFTERERSFVDAFASQAAVAIENARLFGSLRAENDRLRMDVEGRHRFESLIGGSRAMRDLRAAIASVCGNDCGVLILGESGTGKELVARAIHHNGPRRRRKLMAVDCGALPEGLLEAELFGHVRGAFTGADRDRVGLIQEADGGTLFLDEITNTSLALQARLLRVLQEREVRRVGGNTPCRVDVRVIAASNADVPRLVAEGTFRQDLYYRLNVVTIPVPPLRDRREDIPLLIEHLAARRVEEGLAPKAFAPEVHAALARHHWPGNVRELENLVERLMVMAPGPVVTIEDLPQEYRGTGPEPGAQRPSPAGPRDARVDPRTGEQLMIEQALERFGGDKAKAARYIGWNRQKLYRRMKQLSVATDHGRAGSGRDEAIPPKKLRRAV